MNEILKYSILFIFIFIITQNILFTTNSNSVFAFVLIFIFSSNISVSASTGNDSSLVLKEDGTVISWNKPDDISIGHVRRLSDAPLVSFS